MEAIKYDHYGRMQYNPEFHANSGKPWTKEEEEYLIDWYYIIGPEEMSFALERTIVTVMDRKFKLNKLGLMKEPKHRKFTKRIRKEN